MSGAQSSITIQRRVPAAGIPSPASFRIWATEAIEALDGEGELTIRIVDQAESAELNGRYRHKHYATNVLSFPSGSEDFGEPQLGDLVICAQVVAREAIEQGKPARAHWAHMVIHGVLHLLGHDHEHDEEAERMENLEREILGKLGFPDPY